MNVRQWGNTLLNWRMSRRKLLLLEDQEIDDFDVQNVSRLFEPIKHD